MSVLETPRIYFDGQIDWDPIVTNNYPAFYNEIKSEPVFSSKQDPAIAFRASAIEAVKSPDISWNPHGTHRSTFFNTGISGADLGNGATDDDRFVGSPASFRGMLVDLEPYGAFTSQLFFDAMTFGIDGGYRIAAPRSSRFTARCINFGRYTGADAFRAGHASVVWQSCFAKSDGLTIDAFDSHALLALKKAVDDDSDVLGLTVQWNAYRTIYFNDPSFAGSKDDPQPGELIAKLERGGFQPNPARSHIVGVIGLWRRHEPIHEPCDRTLLALEDSPVATAHARVANDRLTLDLSNSISEIDADLTKQNLGELTVVAIPKTGAPVPLGRFSYPQYDRDAYLRSSGIVTIAISKENAKIAATANLELRTENKTLLEETALRAIPDTPNLYLNEEVGGMAVFQVYDRGVPAGGSIPVTICMMSASGGKRLASFALTTATDGTVRMPLSPVQPSIYGYVAVPGPDPTLPDSIDPGSHTYMYVRILPADHDIAALPPTWENVYRKVLVNWKAMAPCMDNWLDLANEAQVRSFGPLIRKLTAEQAFEQYRYMPVTRDLTAGARTLLYNFLRGTTMLTAAAKTEPEEKTVNFGELSRNHRSG